MTDEHELAATRERLAWEQHAARIMHARLAVAELALRKIREAEQVSEAQQWASDAVRRLDELTQDLA